MSPSRCVGCVAAPLIEQVSWSGTGNLVAITTESSFYVLAFDRERYAEYVEAGNEDDEGAEAAFEIQAEIEGEIVRTAKWVGDCFMYTTAQNKLNYLVGGQTHTINHFDRCASLVWPG